MSKVSRKARAFAKHCWTKMHLCREVKPKEKEEIIISSTWHYQI